MGSLRGSCAKVHDLGWCVGSAEALVATQPVPKLLWAIYFSFIVKLSVLHVQLENESSSYAYVVPVLTYVTSRSRLGQWACSKKFLTDHCNTAGLCSFCFSQQHSGCT